MTLPPRAIVALRALTTMFFGATALYGLLNFSPFAYQQFIRPRLLSWLAWSATFYGGLFMAVFSLTLLSLLGDTQRRSTRRMALAYLGVWQLVAIGLLVSPVLDRLGPNAGSLAFAAIALTPALWLAIIDHLACWRLVFPVDQTVPDESPYSRFLAASIATPAYVWAVYAGLARLREPASTLPVPTRLGGGHSFILHVATFAAIGWLLVAAAAAARLRHRPRVVEYVLELLLFAGSIFFVSSRLLFPALAITGLTSLLVAAAFAVVLAACWSGIALRMATSGDSRTAPIDLLIRPALPARSRPAIVAWLLVLPVVAYALVAVSAQADWSFLLQKGGVFAIWLLAWAAMLTLARGARRPSFGAAIAGSLVVLAVFIAVRARDRSATAPVRFQQLAGLSRYAALDASFRTLDDALAERSPTPRAFYQFLEANANVRPTVAIASRPIHLSTTITRAADRPNIFLFVFDSLRPDYLSAYNPAVTFTPSLGALAADSLVFRRAFSRYGGTGLSVPSIWSGTMLPHRQYVLPFTPMNTLLALLEGNAYRVMASMDSVMAQLMPGRPGVIELGADSPRSRDDGCRVMADLRDKLDRSDPGTPTFAYSLPQNTHISYVQGQSISSDRFPGFNAPFAARVRQIDSCLGTFVDYLKARGTYDNSVIVVTSDHGDALGEGGRWGHGSAGFPEIFRIPLIMHLPSRFSARWAADVDAVSFSTDIAPTFYRLLDQEIVLRGAMVGMPLVYPQNTLPPRDRRRGSFLLAGSYGPVDALLQRNGELLYVVDALNARDYAFDLTGDAPRATDVPVTPDERVAYQRVIAEQVDAIAAFFGFDAQPSR